MERFTERFKDGRNILRKGISDVFYVRFGRFFEGEAIDRLAEYEYLEEQGKLLKLPCDTVWFICDKKTKYATIMSKSIRDLAIYEIEGIDKKGYYWSTRDKALAELKEL